MSEFSETIEWGELPDELKDRLTDTSEEESENHVGFNVSAEKVEKDGEMGTKWELSDIKKQEARDMYEFYSRRPGYEDVTMLAEKALESHGVDPSSV